MEDNKANKESKVSKEYKLPIRLTEEQLEKLDYVSKDYGLDKANTIRMLVTKEYKRLSKSKKKSS